MKAKTLAILVVILVLAIAITRLSSRHPVSAPSPMTGKTVLAELPVNSVAKIVFESTAGTSTTARVDDRWVSLDKYNYPVDFEKVRGFLTAMADVKVGQVIRATADQLGAMNLLPPTSTNADTAGVLVTLKDKAGSDIATFIVGKKHYSAPQDDSGSSMPAELGGFPDGRYVKSGDNVYLIGDVLSTMPEQSADWLNTEILSVFSGDVTEVNVTGPDRQPVTLVRDTPEQEPKLRDLKANEEMDAGQAGSLFGAISYMKFEDIADPALTDAETGMENPIVYAAKTKQGMRYTIKLGALGGPGQKYRYVRASVEHEPVSETPPMPETLAPGDTNEAAVAEAKAAELATRKAAQDKLADEAAALNKKLGNWTYMIRDFATASFIVQRDALAKQKEPAKDEKPAVEPSKEGDGKDSAKPEKESKSKKRKGKKSK